MSDILYAVNIGDINICLCPDCFRKTRIKMNEVILDGYISKTESELRNENSN